MREFEEKRRLRRFLLSRPAFVLVLALAALFAFSVFKIYQKSRLAILRNKIVEEELASLEERKQRLEASIMRLQTQEGIEKELRAKFQIKKPGEGYVVILEGNNEQGAENRTQEQSAGLFEKFLNFFKIF